MPRRLAALFLATACALPACGGPSKDEFAADLRPLNDRLLRLGAQLARDVAAADRRSRRANSIAFGRAADAAAVLEREIGELEAPDDLDGERDQLVTTLDKATSKFVQLEKRALRDGLRSAQLIRELRPVSRAVDQAQKELAAEAGLKAEPMESR